MKIVIPFFRTAFNYDVAAVSDETGLSCGEPSRTQQSFAEECDINTIVRRFGLTGELPESPRPPQYGDFTGVSDYQSALNAVIAADAAFLEFPAHIRARFHNDPQALLEFISREENRDEAEKLGLVKKIIAEKAVEAASGNVSEVSEGAAADSKGV